MTDTEHIVIRTPISGKSRPLCHITLACVRARRIGHTYKEIGFALNISYQAVNQRIKRYEYKTGKAVIPKKNPRHRARGVRMARVCDYCGKVKWVTPTVINKSRYKNYKHNYCSHRCYGLGEREISDSMICQVIDLRPAHGWKDLEKMFGFTAQGLQRRIWYYLYAIDQLNVSMLRRIWINTTGFGPKASSWRWLENTTGLRPRP